MKIIFKKTKNVFFIKFYFKIKQTLKIFLKTKTNTQNDKCCKLPVGVGYKH